MNPVTTIELMQVVGIAAGAMVGLIGVFAGIFIWAANVRDKEIGKRLQAVEQLVERRHQETLSEVNRLRQEMMRLDEEGERRHRELLRAIAPLYRHTHAADGQPIVPLPEVVPSGATAAPAPADDQRRPAYLADSVAANSAPCVTHSTTPASDATPSGATSTQPFIGRPAEVHRPA